MPVASTMGTFVDSHTCRSTDVLVVWYDFVLCVFSSVLKYEFIRGEFPFYSVRDSVYVDFALCVSWFVSRSDF